MLRYIFMFVLVMTMVKTNAQGPWGAAENEDKLLIRLKDDADNTDIEALLQKISIDPHYTTSENGSVVYMLLDRTSTGTIDRQDVIDYYIDEDYIASVTFLYKLQDGEYLGNSNDVFVIVDDNTTTQQLETFALQHGLVEMLEYWPEKRMYLLYFDKHNDVEDATEALMSSGLVEWAAPNLFFSSEDALFSYGDRTVSIYDCSFVRSTLDNSLSGPLFHQWGLYTGISSEFSNLYVNYPDISGPAEWSDINVCHAWNFFNGSPKYKGSPVIVDGMSATGPVSVAVLDNGVDTRHYELPIKKDINGAVIGKNTVPTTSSSLTSLIYHPSTVDEGMPDGNSTHGTKVAGIIAAKRNNPSNPNIYNGVVGVAYNAEIVPVRMMWTPGGPDIQYPSSFTIQTATDAFLWAVNTANVDVINCSWGYNLLSTTNVPHFLPLDMAIKHAATNGRNGNGCIIIGAAGNLNSPNIAWPSSHKDVIAVGASDMCNYRKTPGQCDVVTSWGSNFGVGKNIYYVDANGNTVYYDLNEGLSVVAPGHNLITTTPINDITNTSTSFGMTSGAAPHVSGVAALMLSVNPCLTNKEVRNIIEKSTDGISPNNIYAYAYNKTNGYWDLEVGYGKVNAGNAVTLAYDVYLQEKVENGSEIYHASHYIFAGDGVTNVKRPLSPVVINQNYTIQSGADIKFYVPNGEGIVLTHGFTAEYGSNFLADPDVNINCTTSHHHYKPGKERISKRYIPSGKQPILSSSDNLLHDIRVYPNPAKETINIEFMLEDDADVSFTMLNMLGQKMKETETTGHAKGMQKQQMSLQGLVPGVYFVGIKTPAGYSQFRFIKE